MRTILDRFQDLELRIRILLGVGIGVVLAALIWGMVSRSPDVAVEEFGAAQPEGTAVVAPPVAPQPTPPGETVAAPGEPTGVAPLTSSGRADTAEPAIPQTDLERAWTNVVNEDVPPPRRKPTAQDEMASASTAVREAGTKLLQWKNEFNHCWDIQSTEGDWRSCLGKEIKLRINIDEMWEMGAGYRISVTASDGTHVVFVRQTNGAECRSVKGSESCSAW